MSFGNRKRVTHDDHATTVNLHTHIQGFTPNKIHLHLGYCMNSSSSMPNTLTTGTLIIFSLKTQLYPPSAGSKRYSSGEVTNDKYLQTSSQFVMLSRDAHEEHVKKEIGNSSGAFSTQDLVPSSLASFGSLIEGGFPRLAAQSAS